MSVKAHGPVHWLADMSCISKDLGACESSIDNPTSMILMMNNGSRPVVVFVLCVPLFYNPLNSGTYYALIH